MNVSAHPPKAVILSNELVARFALYLHRLDAELGDPPIRDWGVFYQSLKGSGQNRGHLGPVAPWGLEPLTQWRDDEERELVAVFDLMSASQRRRMCDRAEAADRTTVQVWRDFEVARLARVIADLPDHTRRHIG